MNPSEHLTRNQIAAFSAGSLAASESRSFGGHLIRCVECRSLLPLPNPSQVWTAITTEHAFDASRWADNLESSDLSYSQTVAAFFDKRTRLAWTGGVLVIVSLVALFIFTAPKQREVETEVARSFQLENPISPPNGNKTTEMNTGLPASSGADSGVRRVNSNSTDGGRVETRRNAGSGTTTTDTRTTGGIKRNISATRGSTTPCAAARTIEMELGSQKSDLILRWKRVPKAAKYHLYVSDDSEILIDEFETDQDTSYIIKKPLDPSKAYKWKIVITLENGRKLYADAQKFTAKDFQSSFDGYKTKTRSNTRCLANE